MRLHNANQKIRFLYLSYWVSSRSLQCLDTQILEVELSAHVMPHTGRYFSVGDP